MADGADREGQLPAILPPEEAEIIASDGGDDLAARESIFFDKAFSQHRVDAMALRNELARAYIGNLKADRKMRKTYASRILRYLETYSVGVALIVLADGFGIAGFDLDNSIVTALVGSTAVAAIGLVGFIARGLFRAPSPPPSDD